jgi:hypothetical protein
MSTAVSTKSDRFRRWPLLAAPCLLVAWQTSCSSDSSSLSCGPGTQRSGNQCVLEDEAAGGGGGTDEPGAGGGGNEQPTTQAGDGSGGEPVEMQVGPKFAGLTSTAPASDVAIQLTWDAAEDASTPAAEITYRVYVATKSGKQNFGKPSLTSAPGASSAVVGNLEPDTDYYFVVRAVNAAGEEDENEVELVGTPTVDDQAPEFDGLKKGEPAGAAAVKLSWPAASDDLTPPEGISYIVRWATSEEGAPFGAVALQTPPGATSAEVPGLPTPSDRYFFNVSAQDATGNVATNSVVLGVRTGADTTPPRFGGCTGATDPGATTALLSWEPALDDTSSPQQVVYNVYAFTSAVDEDTAFGNPVGSFISGQQGRVEGLASGTEYYFVCRAQDFSGNEDTNIAVRVLETKSDGEPPEFDGIVGATPGATTVDLTWGPAKDPGDKTPPEEIVYLVYQSTNPDALFAGSPVATSNPGATGLTLSGLQSNTPYYWGVRARDNALNTDENTHQLSATTLVSLSFDIQPILSRNCATSSCHSGDNPPQGMSLDVGRAYAGLVNTPSIEAAAYKRVQPGDPTKSYMIHKLRGTNKTPEVGGSGAQMPKDATPLPEDVIELIELWITQGAGDN